MTDAIIKFPMSEDFGGMNQNYLNALKMYQDYIKAEINRLTLKKGKQDWCNEENNIIRVQIALLLTNEKIKAAINNLVGYANHQGKRIIKDCQFEQDNSLFYYAKIA